MPHILLAWQGGFVRIAQKWLLVFRYRFCEKQLANTEIERSSESTKKRNALERLFIKALFIVQEGQCVAEGKGALAQGPG